MNFLYPFFKWANSTSMSQVINDSSWLFPAIEGVHIAALALLFGAILVLNLRLMGLMMRDRSLPQLSRELETVDAMQPDRDSRKRRTALCF